MIKIVGDKKYGELIGGHIVGAKATELIQELVNAQGARGRLPRGRAHHPRPPDAVGGRDGGRARRRRLAHPRLSAAEQPRFYYDLASPEAYLAAERAPRVLGDGARVGCRCGSRLRAGELGRSAAPRRSTPTARTSSAAPRALGLQPLRWPDPFPRRHRVGDARRDLREADRPRAWRSRSPRSARRSPAGATSASRDTVLIAAAACEMHPAAVIKGAELRSITRAALRRGDRRRRAPPACSTCPPSRSATASSTATASSRRPRRRCA